MEIGARIKTLRKEANLTVDELAKKIGKNRATIYRYENGDIKDLPISILESLALALNTTPAYLMGWTKDVSQESLFPQVYIKLLEKNPDLYDAIKLYTALDNIDRSEIRGEMKGMLHAKKYYLMK